MKKSQISRAVIGAVAVVGLVAGCSDGDESLPAKRTSTTNAATTTSATTTTMLDTYKVGDTVTLTSGATITVKVWEPKASGISYDADPGTHYAAAQIEECRGTTGTTDDRSDNPSAFSLLFASKQRVTGGIRRSPELPESLYAPGECVVGWASFDVPDTETPQAVVLEFIDGVTKKPHSIKWMVS